MLLEVVIENNHSENKIAVVDVNGVISSQSYDSSGQNMVEMIEEQFKTAASADEVKAVILKINSPGGEVLASDEIYQVIKNFQKKTGKPVIASMQALAASGGYYVAAPCQWIVASEMTITGSIGVIMHGYNYRGLMAKIGMEPEVFKSGKFKDMASGEKWPSEITQEEKDMVQGLVMETYSVFTNIVFQGRKDAEKANSGDGKALSPQWSDFVDGRILSGKQAAELGFVDEVGNFRKAVDRALALADIKDADLIQYQQPFDLGNLFRLFGKTDVKSVKVDLGLKRLDLQPGGLYFMYPLAIP
jgi:protease-4